MVGIKVTEDERVAVTEEVDEGADVEGVVWSTRRGRRDVYIDDGGRFLIDEDGDGE